MSKNKSYVKVDTKKNRLYIKVSAKSSKRDFDELYTDIRFGASDLTAGFHVIADFSECSLAALSCISTYKRIANYLIEARAGIVVRIINKSSVLFRQAINFASRYQGYITTNVTTLEEAEAALIDAENRYDLRFYLHKQEVILSYKETEYPGIVSDISIGGCAVECRIAGMSKKEQLDLAMTFDHEKGLLTDFKASVEVVRAEPELLALKFLALTDEEKDKLWKRLLHEAQN